MTRFASPHSRWLVAALMVVALPWCCCSGRLFSGAFAEATASLVAVQGDETGGCCRSGSKDEQPSPCDDDRSCGCDQHKQIKNRADGPAAVDLSPTLTALLPAIAPPAPHERFSTIQVLRREVPRPATSLLRLHCALIV